MDRCDECGFDYDEVELGDVPDRLRTLAMGYRQRLDSEARGSIPAARLRVRPEPDVWSVIEYACHIRDVLLVQRDRMLLALVEERPAFRPMYRDERVGLAGYADEEPETVAHEIGFAADLLARNLARLAPEQWQRTCVYGYPAPAVRTLAWQARHTLHEAIHHLRDIDLVAKTVAATI